MRRYHITLSDPPQVITLEESGERVGIYLEGILKAFRVLDDYPDQSTPDNELVELPIERWKPGDWIRYNGQLRCIVGIDYVKIPSVKSPTPEVFDQVLSTDLL